MTRVLVAAGASGGHVYPALATAEVLRERGHDVVFVGGDRLEARIVPEAGFPFHGLSVKRPPSVRLELLTPRGVRSMASIALATVRARRLVGSVAPDVVLGMGGFAAVPVTLAAASKRVALVLHEQNANLSLAQRIPLRWARVLALGLPLSRPPARPRTELVGQPVRARLTDIARLSGSDREHAQHEARRRLGLADDNPTLLVFGGSLGSGPLNESVPRAFPLPAGIQVLHIAGPSRDEPVRESWKRAGVPAVVLGYLDSIEDAYLAADLVVSRSGAATVAELAIAGLPSILVPLPTLARGDQEANARVLEKAGAATVILQSAEGFTAAVGSEVTRLFGDGAILGEMAAGARTVARPDAALRLAEVIESVAP